MGWDGMGWHCRLDFPEVLVDGFRSCWVLILMSFFPQCPYISTYFNSAGAV